MRKLTFLLTLALLFIPLNSCSRVSLSPYDLMGDFVSEYRGTGTVFTSKASVGEAGYITDEMCKQLFTDNELIPLDYAVYMYSRLDTVTEVGMLSSVGKADKADITAMCLSRLDFLKEHALGEGGVILHSGVVIYYFSSDTRVKAALEKIT